MRAPASAPSLLAALSLAALLPAAAGAATLVVRDGESIQDAVDAASPGDVIHVLPGVYTAPPGTCVVHVTQSDLTLRGSPNAVIDASGHTFGVCVGELGPLSPAGCPPITVNGFRLEGFTVRDAGHTGAFLIGVDGFELRGGRYLDNDEYGPFPVCSQNGRIVGNFASGHDDAAIYVGDDDGVVVENNVVTDSTIGVEIENSENSIVRRNLLTGNTAGILVVVLPGLPKPFTEDVLIVHNTILANNRPNPFAPTDPDDLSQLPVGTGILNVGGDRVTILRNVILRNQSFGVGLIGNPFVFFDARIEPFVDENEVRRNVILANGSAPDPDRPDTPGADIVFGPDVAFGGVVLIPDPDPSDNCFADNVFRTDFPDGVTSLFPCP
jgi:parallel beta-helix repeat protein